MEGYPPSYSQSGRRSHAAGVVPRIEVCRLQAHARGAGVTGITEYASPSSRVRKRRAGAGDNDAVCALRGTGSGMRTWRKEVHRQEARHFHPMRSAACNGLRFEDSNAVRTYLLRGDRYNCGLRAEASFVKMEHVDLG